MYISELSDGSLKMTACVTERTYLDKLLKNKLLNGYAREAAFIAQWLRPTYVQTAPCSVGALTDAPMITNGIKVWAFMNYQVECFLESLRDGKNVIWQQG